VTDYLLVNLAHLQVNTATAEEMAPVLGVTMGVAEGVVAYRDARGGFKTIDDLKGVPELDAATIDALAPRLLFGN
jgi:competence protein ComEA